MPTSADVYYVASRADAQTLIIPSVIDIVETAGYHAHGDQGGALYKRVTTEPTHAGKFQDDDGAWFEICSLEINARQFAALGDAITDDTESLQKAIDYCQTHGKDLFVPEGRYLISAPLVVGYTPAGHDYRLDAFRIYGAGAVSIWLDYASARGTVIFGTDDHSLIEYDKNSAWAEQSGKFCLDNIRFQQTDATAEAPVIKLNYLGGFSELRQLEIVHDGMGDGIALLDGNGDVRFTQCNIANRDLEGSGLGEARVGTALSVASSRDCCLVTIQKVRCRGFLNGFVVSRGLAFKLDQAECSMVTNGITIENAVYAANVESCHFEGIDGTAIIDRGNGTIVKGCNIYAYGVTGIDSSSEDNKGSLYIGNTIFLNQNDSIGIDLFSRSDGWGQKKVVVGNTIDFQGSGASSAFVGVKGVRITSSSLSFATCVDISANTFKPERAWVGGAGTIKIDHQAGRNIGVMPLTDQYNEYPLFSQIGLMLATGAAPLTASDVVSGTLSVSAASAYDMNGATTVTNITSIVPVDNQDRWLKFYASDDKMVFKRGSTMLLSADFTGPGMLLVEMRKLGGTWYAFEISRASY